MKWNCSETASELTKVSTSDNDYAAQRDENKN